MEWELIELGGSKNPVQSHRQQYQSAVMAGTILTYKGDKGKGFT